jgi:hypothetical protein
MRVVRIMWLAGFLIIPAVSLAWAGESSSLFDKPLHETHTTLPPDPDNPYFNKPLLSCFYYPNFMVKQLDFGEKGAEQLSILPYWIKDHAEPPCLRANAKDEMVIDRSICDCYFEGAKDDFVFLTAADGFDGGSVFVVINSVDASRIFVDAAKLTKDSSEFTSFAVLNYPKNDRDSALELHYRRVYRAPCSLHADEKNCWGLIRNITGLTESSPPNCATAYEAEEKKSPADAKSLMTDPSVITYEVEIVLNSGNVIRVTPVSKAMECYPAH